MRHDPRSPVQRAFDHTLANVAMEYGLGPRQLEEAKVHVVYAEQVEALELMNDPGEWHQLVAAQLVLQACGHRRLQRQGAA